MTEFSRRGHFRVNADGTRFWVSPHVVDRQHYSLTVVGKNYFVDENKLLLKEICKYCSQTIYYAYLNKDKKVFFNSLNQPLTIHNCTKHIKSDKVPEAVIQAKKYLSPHEVNALSARAEAIKQRAEKNKRQTKIDKESQKKEAPKSEGKKKKKGKKNAAIEARRRKLRQIEEKQKVRQAKAERRKKKIEEEQRVQQAKAERREESLHSVKSFVDRRSTPRASNDAVWQRTD